MAGWMSHFSGLDFPICKKEMNLSSVFPALSCWKVEALETRKLSACDSLFVPKSLDIHKGA